MTAPQDRLLLSPGLVITGVAELPLQVRERLASDERDGFVVTKPHGRAASTLVDAALAALLEEFREPSTVVEAFLRYSDQRGLDPDDALTRLYPAVRHCRRQGFLVAAGSERAEPVEPLFAVGSEIAGGRVVRCLRVLEDSELHELALDDGGRAVLKLLRPARSSFGDDALQREAAVLRHLDGRVAPRLLASGARDGCQWLALEWCDGVLADRAAGLARREADADAALLRLCGRVAEAYAQLHELGVVHGDVHPGNVLVAPDGTVRLVDFGLATIAGATADTAATAETAGAALTAAPPPRGGVHAYYDPEHAAAARAGRQPPAATFASDQFSLGALLYELMTGSCYLDFALDRAELLRQVADDDPLPFVRRGWRPWPQVERLLRTTLAKDPAARLPSTRVLARGLAAVAAPPPPATSDRPRSPGLQRLLDQLLAAARPGGSWFEEGLPAGVPSCSVAYGAAGVAAALCRVAALRADPELLSLADEWCVRAAREADRHGAFASDELGLDARVTGRVTPFHSVSGVHAVQALVSNALDDSATRQRALEAFAAASRLPCETLDLTLGRAGTLLAAALLLEAVGGARHVDVAALVALGDETLAGLWRELDALGPIGEQETVRSLGIAHGWAGLLFASLRWCGANGGALPAHLPERLDQLAALARPAGLGLRWPLDNRPGRGPSTLTGWCHGSGGYVHLWTLAHALLGDERWATLAEQAAADAYATPNRVAQLCCGQAGTAYGLLALYRHSGERRWLTAAGELAAGAAATGAALAQAPVAASLHKGIAGIAVLAADLELPEQAAMPFFAAEG